MIEVNLQKKTIGITLFEAQLLRVYVSSNDGQLIRNLEQDYSLIIFTSENLRPFVTSLLDKLNILNFKIIIFNLTRESFINRVFSSPLRWSVKSSSVYLKVMRKSMFNRTVPYICFRIISKFKIIKNVLRFFLYATHPQHSISKEFDQAPPMIDKLLVTSLTNGYEDFKVALYYRRQRIPILGTIRSWDNLTSHGNLYLEPDIFLSHSEWITYAAKVFQGIPAKKIIEWGNPAYASRYNHGLKLKQTSSVSKEIKITYASMAGTNRDDANFIIWLCTAWKEMPSNYKLSILSHPKFAVDPAIVPNDIDFISFDFLTSKLETYYAFLNDQDLVLCGGTSVILDCAFTQTPIVLINFEIQKQVYWFSALRYFDTISHSCSIFSSFDYKYANTKEKLIDLMLKKVYEIEPNRSPNFYITLNSLTLPSSVD